MEIDFGKKEDYVKIVSIRSRRGGQRRPLRKKGWKIAFIKDEEGIDQWIS